MRKFIIFAGFTAVLIGQDKKITYDESFDPNTLNEPEIEIPIILHPGDKLPAEMSPVSVDTTEEGYRVQVLSTQDYEAAHSLMEELSLSFEDEVYVVFDSPYYKVRIGNFRSRYNAEKAQARLAQIGYKGAWIIRTSIKVKPSTKRE